MRINKSPLINIQPTIIAVLIFLILVFASISYTRYQKGLWEKDIRSEMLNIITTKKSNLEKVLYSRICYTRGIAAYARSGNFKLN